MTATRSHASVVLWREDGFLIRGNAGSGKSTLAAAFVREGARSGLFARLVADDAVLLRATGQRLIARPHERIAGLIERRGIGILPIDHEPACVVRLVIDLATTDAAALARMPSPEDLTTELLGITLPRLLLRRDAPALDNVYCALDFFAAFRAYS